MVYTTGLEICDVDVAILIICDQTAHVGRCTKLRGGNHAISGAATAGVISRRELIGKMIFNFGLTGFVNERHHAFFNRELIKVIVGNIDFSIDQSSANRVDEVIRHSHS